MKPPRRRSLFLGLAAAGLVAAGGLGSGRAATESFELPPDQPPAALLPPTQVAGENFHIVDPVHSDGLMHRFVVDSHFGKFDAYGRFALEVRIKEVAALTQLAKISSVGVVADSIGNGVKTQVTTAEQVALHPVDTITGIPKGVAHLFGGFVAQGKEAAAAAKSAVSGSSSGSSSGGQSQSTLDKSEAAAKGFAEQYLGVTAADRRWYKKLGVDPYTNNQLLRQTVHRDAQIDATASFGLKFVAPTAISQLGYAQRAVDAIYNEDPAVLRARQKDVLAAWGLTPAEVEHFQNNLLMSPTRQTLLVGAAQALDGVDGRAELFRHATGLTSDDEAQVYLRSVALLVVAHREAAVKSILPGVRLPAARRADGGIVVCGAFEAIYWTAQVAEGAHGIGTFLPADSAAAAREFWLEGTVTERARHEFEQRGWRVRQNVSASVKLPPLPPPAAPKKAG